MSITYQQHEAHARAVRQDHDGRTSRGLSLEIARLAFDNPIFRDDPAELLSDLKQCAAACIGAGCEPRFRPLPGHGQGVSLAAPAEADQVEGTKKATINFCQYCGSSDIEHFCHTLPDYSASCKSCGAHLFNNNPNLEKISFDGWYLSYT